MPATRPPSLAELPPVATVAEIASFERVDDRTIRKAIAAGELPGAFLRGDRAWRIRTDVYLASMGKLEGSAK